MADHPFINPDALPDQRDHPLTRLRKEPGKFTGMPAPTVSTAMNSSMPANDQNDVAGRPWWSPTGEHAAAEREGDDPYTRTVMGRERRFGTEDAAFMLARGRAYLDYCADRPFVTEKIVTGKSGVVRVPEFHVRAPSEFGLATALHCDINTLRRMVLDNTPAGRIVHFFCSVIVDFKIAGAHAGMFNANLVAREHGLADKLETTQDVQLGARQDPTKFAERPHLVHPDDPSPETATLLFTAAQLAAGVPYPTQIIDVTPPKNP